MLKDVGPSTHLACFLKLLKCDVVEGGGGGYYSYRNLSCKEVVGVTTGKEHSDFFSSTTAVSSLVLLLQRYSDFSATGLQIPFVLDLQDKEAIVKATSYLFYLIHSTVHLRCLYSFL